MKLLICVNVQNEIINIYSTPDKHRKSNKKAFYVTLIAIRDCSVICPLEEIRSMILFLS